MKEKIQKLIKFLNENWFKVTIVILIILFLTELHTFNNAFSKTDWSGEDINSYYHHKLCDEGVKDIRCLR